MKLMSVVNFVSYIRVSIDLSVDTVKSEQKEDIQTAINSIFNAIVDIYATI